MISELRHSDASKRQGGRIIAQRNAFQCAERVTRSESTRRRRDQ
jgi:hypothetical protein